MTTKYTMATKCTMTTTYTMTTKYTMTTEILFDKSIKGIWHENCVMCLIRVAG